MAFRDLPKIMPAVDEIIMQILGMSEALNEGRLIGWTIFDVHRPTGWPTASAILVYHGFSIDKKGWSEFAQSTSIRQKTTTIGRHRNKGAKWCRVCGDLCVYGWGRCHRCYKYYRRHRRERPAHLWNRDAKCKTCGIPLSSLTIYRNKKKQTSGYCQPCYTYMNRHKSSRPRHLWNDGPHGWCECGSPAIALVEDMPVCNKHKE